LPAIYHNRPRCNFKHTQHQIHTWGVRHRIVWWEQQLERTDLVPCQLPHHRVAAKVRSVLAVEEGHYIAQTTCVPDCAACDFVVHYFRTVDSSGLYIQSNFSTPKQKWNIPLLQTPTTARIHAHDSQGTTSFMAMN